MHRDIKPSNILLNFPNIDIDMALKGGQEVVKIIMEDPLIDKVEVVIADLGLAK